MEAYRKVIEGRIQAKATRGRKIIGMLSDLMGKEDSGYLKVRDQDRN